MVFLHIDSENYNKRSTIKMIETKKSRKSKKNTTKKSNKSKKNKKTNIDVLYDFIKSNKKVFILVYMEGCGPCNATRPEWSKIKNVLEKYKNNKNVLIVDMENDLLQNNKIKKLNSLQNIIGLPTIRIIKRDVHEDYEGNRDIDSFVEWIERN
jgi:thiol-disulfide isomerase/thioredoxin